MSRQNLDIGCTERQAHTAKNHARVFSEPLRVRSQLRAHLLLLGPPPAPPRPLGTPCRERGAGKFARLSGVSDGRRRGRRRSGRVRTGVSERREKVPARSLGCTTRATDPEVMHRCIGSEPTETVLGRVATFVVIVYESAIFRDPRHPLRVNAPGFYCANHFQEQPRSSGFFRIRARC